MFTQRFDFRRLAAAAFCLGLLVSPPWIGAARAADKDLTANDILRAVREGQANRHETLNGQLRDYSSGKTFPFRLTADGPTVRYQFPGPPPTVFQVHYNEDNSQLEESTGNGPAERLAPGNFDKPILGTALAYEDLALRFVYWSRATLLESDDTTTFPAYKLRLNAPSARSQYSYVLLWLDKRSFALLHAEGFDAKGQLVKRFNVNSGQKIEGRWYLKEMRIEKIEPDSGKVTTRSALEIKGVEK